MAVHISVPEHAASRLRFCTVTGLPVPPRLLLVLRLRLRYDVIIEAEPNGAVGDSTRHEHAEPDRTSGLQAGRRIGYLHKPRHWFRLPICPGFDAQRRGVRTTGLYA